MSMTAEQMEKLNSINTLINAVPYVATPGPTEPVDYWTYEPEAGKSWVCRMYTQAKSDWLRHHGFDPMKLTVVLCFTELFGVPQAREYHAVLCVDDGDGEPLILDSRTNEIYPLASPLWDYRWDRRQVPGTEFFELMT